MNILDFCTSLSFEDVVILMINRILSHVVSFLFFCEFEGEIITLIFSYKAAIFQGKLLFCPRLLPHRRVDTMRFLLLF